MDAPRETDPDDLLQHAAHLRRLARALVTDANEADDLAQEAWVEILEGRAHPGSARNPAAWLVGILRNLRRERARGSARRVRREAESARPEEVRDGTVIVERLETFRRLAAELEALEEPYRTSLWQRYFAGLSAEEIARREGVSAATVRSRWMRALAQMRARLDRGPGGRERWLSALALVMEARPAVREAQGAGPLIAACALVAVTVGGAFALAPGEGRSGAALELDGDLAQLQEPLDLAAPQSSARAAAAASVAPAGDRAPATAPARIVLLDAFSGQRVPHARIVVRAGSVGEAVTTDSLGRATTGPMPLGTLGVEVVDDPRVAPTPAVGERRNPRRARPVQHDGRSEIVVAAPFGHAFELALTVPAGVDVEGLVARLDAPDVQGPVRSATARVRAGAGTDASFGADGANAWVRFGAETRWFVASSSSSDLLVRGVLDVETPDGRFGASSEVRIGEPRHDPIRLILHERAGLAIRASDARGEPLAARVEVQTSDGVLRAGDAPRGEFVVTGLEPAGQRVRVVAFGRAPLELVADAAHPFPVVEAVLPDALPGGRVSGVLRRTLAPGERARVVLRDARGVEVAREFVGTAHGPRSAFAFAFDDVPAGDYRLELDGAPPWDVPAREVSPPALGVELVERARTDDRPLVVKARDADTGLPVERFEVLLRFEDGTEWRRTTSLGGITVVAPPAGARFDVWVHAPTHDPAHVAHHDVRRRSDRIGVECELRPRPRPGLGR